MSLAEGLQRFKRRTWRLRTHLGAAVSYQTPARIRNLILAEYEMKAGRIRVKSRPYILIIDPLNVCNLKCPLCPTGTGDLPLKPGKMQLEQFRGLIDQLAPHTFKIMLYNWGEPFMHKDITGMIEHAHNRRIATALSSNLNLLPPGGGEAIVRAGLDNIIVSCDGITQDIYGKYRRGGTLDKLEKNLCEIAAAKKKLGRKNPVIEFQFLVFRHNEHQLPEVETYARKLGADFTRATAPSVDPDQTDIQPSTLPEFVRPEVAEELPNRLNVFHPSVDQEAAAQKFPPGLRCFWPWRAMTINWNGDVDPCCRPNYRGSFGNVFEESIDDIWNNDAYQYARKWIAGKISGEVPKGLVCRGCPGYE